MIFRYFRAFLILSFTGFNLGRLLERWGAKISSIVEARDMRRYRTLGRKDRKRHENGENQPNPMATRPKHAGLLSAALRPCKRKSGPDRENPLTCRMIRRSCHNRELVEFFETSEFRGRRGRSMSRKGHDRDLNRFPHQHTPQQPCLRVELTADHGLTGLSRSSTGIRINPKQIRRKRMPPRMILHSQSKA